MLEIASNDLSINQSDSRRKRGVRTRARICSAARELFLNEGFNAVSVDQIAIAAGVGRSTLYSHFNDKNAILAAICDDYLASAVKVIEKLPGPRPSRRQIDRWIAEFAEFVLQERVPSLLLIGTGIGMGFPPVMHQFAVSIMQAYARQLPAFAEAFESSECVAHARAIAVLRELSWALVFHVEEQGSIRAANMLEVAGDLLEQFIKGWF